MKLNRILETKSFIVYSRERKHETWVPKYAVINRHPYGDGSKFFVGEFRTKREALVWVKKNSKGRS